MPSSLEQLNTSGDGWDVPAAKVGKPRKWLTDAYRADLAARFQCDPAAVEWHLDKREEMVACIYDRTEFYGATHHD